MTEPVEKSLTEPYLDEATTRRVMEVTQTILVGANVGNILTGYPVPANDFARHFLFNAIRADLAAACREAPPYLEWSELVNVLLLQLEAPVAPGCTASLLVARRGDAEAYRQAHRRWPYLAFTLDTLMGRGPGGLR